VISNGEMMKVGGLSPYLCTKMVRQYLDDIGDLKRVPTNVESKTVKEDHGQDARGDVRVAFSAVRGLFVVSRLQRCPNYLGGQ
jgi:hypothetical protein